MNKKVLQDQFSIEYAPGFYGCGDCLIIYSATEFEDLSIIAEYFISIYNGIKDFNESFCYSISKDNETRSFLSFNWALTDAERIAKDRANNHRYYIWQQTQINKILETYYIFTKETDNILRKFLFQKPTLIDMLIKSNCPSLAKKAQAYKKILDLITIEQSNA